MRSIGRRAAGTLPLIAALGLAGLLAACSSGGGGGSMQTAAAPPAAYEGDTNDPVGGGVNVVPGSEEDLMVNVGRRTFFREGSSALDDTARATLEQQAAWLVRYPQWKVKIQGFADDPGGPDANRVLSQQRADAVRNYLVSKGVAPDRMWAKGYGRDRLVQDCPDISCKAQNRRVITNPQDAPDGA